MRWLLTLAVLYACHDFIVCRPVRSNEAAENEDDYKAHFRRYLQEVLMTIGDNPDVIHRLRNFLESNVTEYDDDELFWNMSLRNKLDELKHREIERIRSYARNQHEMAEFNRTHDYFHEHNSRFTSKDFRKAVEHFKKLDKLEEEKYKQHIEEERDELAREYDNASDTERVKLMKELNETAARHAKHPKIHHPGSKSQLREFWEKKEGMPSDTFNPRILFSDLDINGDGFLDVYEITSLMRMELEKVYNESDPKYDPWKEKIDEHGMRKEFLRLYDHNDDLLVTPEEFIQTLASRNHYIDDDDDDSDDDNDDDDDDDWKTAQDEEDRFETDEQRLKQLAEALKHKRQTEQLKQSLATEKEVKPDHFQTPKPIM